jgi:hypothetical protein
MRSADEKTVAAPPKKLSYRKPSAINVGEIATLTRGHSNVVGDPPHDGSSYDKGAKKGRDPIKLIDLD